MTLASTALKANGQKKSEVKTPTRITESVSILCFSRTEGSLRLRVASADAIAGIPPSPQPFSPVLEREDGVSLVGFRSRYQSSEWEVQAGTYNLFLENRHGFLSITIGAQEPLPSVFSVLVVGHKNVGEEAVPEDISGDVLRVPLPALGR